MSVHHQTIILVDPTVRGMSRVADQLEATPCLPSRMAMRLQVDLAKQNTDKPVEVAVVVPATRVDLIVFAHLLHADRVALYYPANLPIDTSAVRAVFAVVDLTLAPGADAVTQAIQAGADPDRIAIPGPEAVVRLFREPPRKTLKRGVFEMAVSLLFDLSDRSHLLDVWEKMTPDQGVNVVNYHRVLPLDEITTYCRPQMALAEPVFAAQLETMGERRGFVPLEKIHDDGATGRVAVTFDDGYEDNFRVALPWLQTYSAPAAIFVVTGLIGHPEALWWDRVGLSLFSWWKHGATSPVPPELPERVSQLKSVAALSEARTVISAVLSDLNQVPEPKRDQAVLAAEQLVPELEVPRTMLTWDEVQTLHRAGVDFGSHTRNHVPLDELPSDLARQELMGSQADLDDRLGAQAYATTALPRGRLGELSEDDLRSRFRSVMTTEPGVHDPRDSTLFVPRRDGRMLTLAGRHHPAKLRWELTGVIDRLRRAYYRVTKSTGD